MLDIKMIRSESEKVKQSMHSRQMNLDENIDKLIEINDSLRKFMGEAESLKSEQNAVSKRIPQMKQAGEDTTAIMLEMKEISDKISEYNKKITALQKKQIDLLYTLPNVLHESVPVGKDEKENPEVRRWGEPRKFEFEPKAHWDVGNNLNILDAERAAKTTGTRFNFYKDSGARLIRAIKNFFLDIHTENGYKQILPPFIVNENSMIGTGQLPKFKEDAFKLEGLDYYLIPTAEVPVTNVHRDEILDGKTLPIKYCAYSPCFRAEAGSAGRDTRGVIRQHQFNKVELVKFSRPEDSYKELESLTKDAEKVLQLLELPHRVISLCTGDMGFSMTKTYDIEVWMPSYNRYVEISSCSNAEDFQSRRAAIRYKDNLKDKAALVHTLNGSGLAIDRTFAAILENFQNADGSVTVPKVLQKYMGMDVIK